MEIISFALSMCAYIQLIKTKTVKVDVRTENSFLLYQLDTIEKKCGHSLMFLQDIIPRYCQTLKISGHGTLIRMLKSK